MRKVIAKEDLGRFTWGRPITSYTRVHVFVSDYLTPITRNKSWLVRKSRWSGLEYLNVGCGYNIYDGFVNVDLMWKPGVLVWDISRIAREPLPFADGTFKGVFTEHCLEHVDFDAAWDNLREYHRLLKPGGTLRVVVPDGEIYIDGWIANRAGRPVELPYARERKEATPMISINRIARLHHSFLYDHETLAYMMREVGFKDIRKEKFRSGRDPRLLQDSDYRELESLYVEATK